MNILFITHFFVGFMVSEILRVSVFGTVRIRLLSPSIYLLGTRKPHHEHRY